MNFPLIANIIVFVVLLFVLAQARHKQCHLNIRGKSQFC